MTARGTVVALGVVLLAGAGVVRADDHAVHRGGDSGSQSSGAGDRHPSSGAPSSSSSSSSSSDGGGGSYTGAVPRTGAEGRHPRPGTGSGARGYYYGSPYYPYYGYGYGYGYPYGFYGSFAYGYSPYYSGYYGYSPAYYGGGQTAYGYGAGSLRLMIEPNQARVYVDGYYAGIVDDFDGVFQRLYLSPGRHDVTVKLEGFRTYHAKLYVPIDQTLKIHYKMIAGAGPDVDEATIGVPPLDEARSDNRPEAGNPRPYEDQPRPDRDEAAEPGDRGDPADRGEAGTLRLEVRPDDASVYVDGEFRGTPRQVRMLSLPPGMHRVEIVRPGFQTVDREVEIRPGHTTTLEADLGR